MDEFDEDMDEPMPSAPDIAEIRYSITSGPRSRSLEHDLVVSSVVAIVAIVVFCLPLLFADGPGKSALSTHELLLEIVFVASKPVVDLRGW